MSTDFGKVTTGDPGLPIESGAIPHTTAGVGERHRRVIDRVYDALSATEHESEVHRALDDLFLSLQEVRLSCQASDWRHVVAACRSHPLQDLLQEDPFTHRAFHKPRGYAGDAVLMDYIYCREERWEAPKATPRGRMIFDFTTQAPASQGVRARRGFVADSLDALASYVRRPDVLSIAAGHLREASLTAAVRRGKLGRFVALDADSESLAEIRHSYGAYGVETVHARFRELVTGRIQLGYFDYVYTTGLFDYLSPATAQRLVGIMFQMLRPRGRLMVANFLPGIRDIGYMEAYMDWNLVYRTRYDMLELTTEISQSDIDDVRLFAEENQNIIFLEVTRA